jgi:hypothetical protein
MIRFRDRAHEVAEASDEEVRDLVAHARHRMAHV